MKRPLPYKLAVPDESGLYTQNFDVTDEARIKEFFEEYGFVVIRNALTGEECEKSISTIFDIIEEATSNEFDRRDVSTWSHWPENSLEQYGSPQISPIFRAQFLNNRQNPIIHRLFSILLGSTELLVNHDRCCLFRPTAMNKEWETKANLHLDMNPWNWLSDNQTERRELEALDYSKPNHFIFENNQPSKSDGVQLQGVINFVDNSVMDGGFVTVPRFHKEFDALFATPPRHTKLSYTFFPGTGPFNRAERVAMPAGAVVVWDQRMAHGSFPNKSEVLRMAQFIKMFPTATVSHRRLALRARSLQNKMQKVLLPSTDASSEDFIEVSNIGRSVFSTELWELVDDRHPFHAGLVRVIERYHPDKLLEFTERMRNRMEKAAAIVECDFDEAYQNALDEIA
jgi:ectoine hydroxylase-related dioxygenase (phytanoyl-CoA dioxygenase family)